MKSRFILLLMSILSCGALSKSPKGELIYCSYRCAGAAGLGTDYCELIADADSIPKVVVVLHADNRFGDPVIRRSYPVERSVVDSLALILAQEKVYKLNGYRLEEPITGGHSYRIYMEYSSGDKVDARWYGSHVKDKAIRAYNVIERFFAPWRERAGKDEPSQETIIL